MSTDEVFGSLGSQDYATEASRYAPRNPYAATKAAADHLVKAWVESFDLQAAVVHSTNCYGPRQHDEKLIPTALRALLTGRTIPLYGDGSHVRDWLYVEDACDALATLFEASDAGQTWCIGGECAIPNTDLLARLADLFDDVTGALSGTSRESIRRVADRPGHDHRYAMDVRRVRAITGWRPTTALPDGLRRTIEWYATRAGRALARPPIEPPLVRSGAFLGSQPWPAARS